MKPPPPLLLQKAMEKALPRKRVSAAKILGDNENRDMTLPAKTFMPAMRFRYVARDNLFNFERFRQTLLNPLHASHDAPPVSIAETAILRIGEKREIIAVMDLRSAYFDALRHDASDREARQSETRCGAENCVSSALYPAPAPDGQKNRIWLCLPHARQYNRAYDFFAGMSADQIDAYQREAIVGHRPTWPLGCRAAPPHDAESRDLFGLFQTKRPPAPILSERERRRRAALRILGFKADATMTLIRQRFKQLAKRYHPDQNGGRRCHEDRLAKIIQAYRTLKQQER